MTYDINLESQTDLAWELDRHRLHDLKFYFPFFFGPTSL